MNVITEKKLKNKTNFLGFRLSEKLLLKLDIIANQENKTRGLIAKEAVKQWINIKQYEAGNEMITIPKKLFLDLIESHSEESLDNITGKMVVLLSDFIKFIFNKPLNIKTLEDYAVFSSNFFGKKGLRWFNNIDVKIENGFYIFRGLHDLGENFSFFFVKIYRKLLSEHFNFDFITKIEESSPFLINLKFKYKND
ncbi:MAG: hypothetical protein JXA99_15750 [Candidatus Lokiarchaeota archaeon]|nr:hypothetical protein [Candidatus Lokiarchaeota archaeon]